MSKTPRRTKSNITEKTNSQIPQVPSIPNDELSLLNKTNFIVITSAIAQEYLNVVKSIGQKAYFADEVIALFIRSLEDDVDIGTRRIIVKILGYLKNYQEEIFPFLVDIFQKNLEVYKSNFENTINYYAAMSMLNFPDLLEDAKEVFLHSLRDSKDEFIRFLAVNILGTKFSDMAKELKSIFKKIMREDKSQMVRIQAWQRFVGLASSDEVKQEQLELKREITYTSILEVLNNIQPGLQVAISRIIDLSDKYYFERAEELRKFGIELLKLPDETYIELIQEILDNKHITGKYFDYEQIFVRDQLTNKPIISLISLSKEYLCYYCGSPVQKTDKKCSECDNEILKCIVCKLPISFGEEVGSCKLCEVNGHFAHFHESVKISGKCPSCLQKLTIDGIIPNLSLPKN